MPRLRLKNSRGSVLVIVTLALISMCAILGLAVDLGWGFYIKKSAQAAADAAALGAAIQGLQQVGPTNPFDCATNVSCSPDAATPLACSAIAGGNLYNGCLYAQQNGFTDGGKSGAQVVTLTAFTSSPPPTAPGVTTYYWVTARVSETIPQLFSAVLGNTFGRSAARATAVVSDTLVVGSLILLNRENDQSPHPGSDLWSNGGGKVITTGPVLLASAANGTATYDNDYAADLSKGKTSVEAPRTEIRGNYILGGGTWISTPNTGVADSDLFLDPVAGRGQPAAPTLSLAGHTFGIAGGTITGSNDPANPVLINEGYFYATDLNGVPTGDPITITGYVKFANNVSPNFGDYVFFGGAKFKDAGMVATFAPGRYFFAGAKPGNTLFETSNAVKLVDGQPEAAPPATDYAGELLVFTDLNYPGLQIPTAVATSAVAGSMAFGQSSLLAGKTDNSLISLHGLNKKSSFLPSALKDFAPFVLWQDQQNSTVKYDASGNIDVTSCGPGHDINSPCPNRPADPPTMEMHLQATTKLKLYGAVYQPRGAWLDLQAGENYAGPLQIISGAAFLGGTPDLLLQGLSNPITVKTISLVE